MTRWIETVDDFQRYCAQQRRAQHIRPPPYPTPPPKINFGEPISPTTYASSPIFRIKAIVRNATDAMKESRIPDILNAMAPLSYRKMDFEEFCAAAISTYQLEALERWEQIASTTFEHFEQEGNRVISVEELARF
ncbi:CDPK-related kinase 4-like [Cornus florida]|uniref:CDPK-related kinase 4-like n=1 Tax=Cornus florida TaxID=4283 RepID=UPI002897C7D6|nr:CDPK-related kinase 4-like [Cornus florida]